MGYRSKCVLLVVAVVVSRLSASAQLEGKVLQAALDQMAELRAYAAVAKEGYKIVEEGWHTVADIRRGEWDLHRTHYGSLMTVNPAVSGVPEVTEILRKTRDPALLRDLILLLTDGQLSMTDGERMRRIMALRKRLK